MAANEEISIYSELLSNLHIVSVAVTLPSPPDANTAGQVSHDGRDIRVQHQGQVKQMTLPCAVVAPPHLSIPAVSGDQDNSIAWRFPQAPRSGPRHEENKAVPWTATTISPKSAVLCRSCKHVLVPEGRISAWKDLPSENWAEMMEFWHCHKPDHEHGQNEEGLAQRGYGANSKIAAQAGSGFVDVALVLFAESDCPGVKFSASSFDKASETITDIITLADHDNPQVFVFCGQCESHVGMYYDLTESTSLFKWKIDCQTVTATVPPTGPDCLAAMLLATISRTGLSKSVIMPQASSSSVTDMSEETALHIWVLNNTLDYSSSRLERPSTAIRLLYRVITKGEAEEILRPVTAVVEEFTLPSQVITTVVEQLMGTTELLPNDERSYEGWAVGLLNIWA